MQFHWFQRHNVNLLQQRIFSYAFSDSQYKFPRKAVILNLFLEIKKNNNLFILKFHRYCPQFSRHFSVVNNNFLEVGFSEVFQFSFFSYVIKKSQFLTFSLTPELCRLLGFKSHWRYKDTFSSFQTWKEIGENKKKYGGNHTHCRL